MPTQVTAAIGTTQLIIETGKMAKLSNGAVTVRQGDTVVLTAADAANEPREGVDFFPLTVDYRERMYAAGKIPGGFFKREGRPSEREILTCRLTDRPIRSLFGKGYRNDVQIMTTVLASDGQHLPDVLSMNGAAAALAISSIPFHAVMGAIRVGRRDGQFLANPTKDELRTSELDMVVAATNDAVVMVECGARQVTEETFFNALKFAHDEIRKIIAAIGELKSKTGKPKDEMPGYEIPAEVTKKVTDVVGQDFNAVNQTRKKEERATKRDELWARVVAAFDQEAPDFKLGDVKSVFHSLEETSVRNLILNENKRADGRAFDEIRPLAAEVGILPRVHGSALFTRGETQSLGVATLGAGDDAQRIDALEAEETKSFMLHYNFPSFSVGEVRPNRGVGRRETGHGALAERAIASVMPPLETFPYTTRLVSDILESNGSSSMASVCSCTLALMDAGVPITAPVAGIAMGLVAGENKTAVLTDIAGLEDHLGDMDFKVAGTEKGITAVQVDLKISGLSYDIIAKALEQARKARLEILTFMKGVIAAPRTEISMHAPRYTVLQINPEKIKNVIGPGGKIIKEITKETGVKIDIEDSGKVTVFSSDSEMAKKAVAWVESITAEAVVGKTYQGKVKRLMNFGAFCEIIPGTEGLVHVSELCDEYVQQVEDVVSIGDEFPVKVIEVDDQGRVNLSAKQAGANLKIKEGATAASGPRPARTDRDRHHRGGPPRRGGRGGSFSRGRGNR